MVADAAASLGGMTPTGPLALTPLPAPPHAVWNVPGSKSLSNRALLLAAMAPGRSELTGVLTSDDTAHMRRALTAMGARIASAEPDRLTIDGGDLHAPAEPVFVGNSGTTVRFLTALAATVAGATQLHGDEHMARRPIADLVDALAALGADIDCPTGCPPLRIAGGGLAGGTVRVRGDRSSQYLSALLMAGAAARGPITIAIEGELVSRPYVAMTRHLVTAFGGAVEDHDGGWRVHPARYRARRYRIEPDASAASYPLALAAASGGRITVPHLTTDALQGDVAFAAILARMGARVDADARGITVTGPGDGLRGVDVDMHHISDTVMTLAAIAPLCRGATTIRNVGNIRIKETDRLAATVAELRRLGQAVTHGDDWLRIDPSTIRPATVECYADHRMAMSFAILGACAPGVRIADPACVGKTYPQFWSDLGALYRAQDTEVPW